MFEEKSEEKKRIEEGRPKDSYTSKPISADEIRKVRVESERG